MNNEHPVFLSIISRNEIFNRVLSIFLGDGVKREKNGEMIDRQRK